ncbi:amino acid-binding protein [Rosenbergiella sp. S61]|uniref:Amino acid-binding protein n=1 Tax=Rosenbergiella gaditana TaxID=2726987 RepID=A0ABS5SZ09_9GAMM|nr:amino acid-binding protein [Rosenbergiella gaditana]MBT0725334.1 amino acid-binding protein [Rosenbergiella gaditana]
MYNIHVILKNQPGSLAEFGKILGENGIGLEGGGVFSTDSISSHANFLVENGEAAQEILIKEGFKVLSISQPIIRKLKQEKPGELGSITNAIALAGINILVQYSDHNNRLILVTDNDKLAREVTIDWAV